MRLYLTDFGKLPVKVNDIFLSLWQGYKCSSVCVLNYIWSDAPEEAAGNTDDFCLCQPGSVINTDHAVAVPGYGGGYWAVSSVK